MANIGETSCCCCLLLFVPSPSAQLRLKSFMTTVKDAIKKFIFERNLLPLLTVVCQLAYLNTLEIKPFGLGSRIRDVEVGCLKNHNFLP